MLPLRNQRKLARRSPRGAKNGSQLTIRIIRREWLHLQSERLRVLAHDRSGKKAGDVKDVLVAKLLVQFAAVGGQSADTALLVLIVNQEFQIAHRLLSATIVGQQRQRFLHRI